jgi:hypothetical protein
MQCGEKVELIIVISFVLLLLGCAWSWLRGTGSGSKGVEALLISSIDVISIEIGVLIVLASYYAFRGLTLQPDKAFLYSKCTSACTLK